MVLLVRDKELSMKLWKKIVISVVGIILVGLLGFLVYVNNYYRANPDVINPILAQENVVIKGNITSIVSDTSDIGFIFYPGGKVEADSYLPLLKKICDIEFSCFLVEMPFNLAVFDINAAQTVIEEHPEINEWYIGGHSLGGVMASQFYASNLDRIEGLILLGSYAYGDVPIEKTITIYGSNDEILDTNKINYKENIYVIDGGNHAGFGDYGNQKGDGPLENLNQQEITAEIILNFILNQ